MNNAAETFAVTCNTTKDNGPEFFTRREMYAATDNGTVANLRVSRADVGQKHTVYWNVNTGRGWCKGWKATFSGYESAIEFADKKWPTLIAWLEKTPSKRDANHSGASEAFSAQVATMMR